MSRTFSVLGTLTARIHTGNGDVVQTTVGSRIVDDAATLDLSAAALRFDDIVPPTVPPVAAHLEWTAATTASDACEVSLRGADERVDVPWARLITDVTLTTAEERWVLPAWSAGETVQSPDLTNLVLEVFGTTHFQNTHALTVVIEAVSGTCARSIRSFDGDGAAAPRLIVETP
jgi:hypothetical protein